MKNLNNSLEIKRIKNKAFYNSDKTKYVLLNGCFLFIQGLGYIRFKNSKDLEGIKLPYNPKGGLRALKDILKGGGFVNYDNIEFLK